MKNLVFVIAALLCAQTSFASTLSIRTKDDKPLQKGEIQSISADNRGGKILVRVKGYEESCTIQVASLGDAMGLISAITENATLYCYADAPASGVADVTTKEISIEK